MRIAVLYQHFLGPGEPGLSRFDDLSRRWVEAGHHVTVVAGSVNYQTGRPVASWRGGMINRSQDQGVDVIRCYVPRSYSAGYAGRRTAYGVLAISAAFGALAAGRVDVLVASSPPLPLVVPAWLKARWPFARVPWIFEVRDLWPESAITTGVVSRSAPLTSALFYLEKWASASAERLVALTPAIADDLVGRSLVARKKVRVLPNGVDIGLFRPLISGAEVRRQMGFADRFIALYAGAHGRANALRQLLDAAEALRDRPDILIAFAGDGPERKGLEQEASERQLSNVLFLGPQPKSRMPDLINAADIGLAVLQRNPTFLSVYPNKAFDYMACEKAVVIAVDGAARKLICSDARAGVFAEPENGQAIASAIEHLANDSALRRELAANGRRWAVENVSWDIIARKYLDLFQELTDQGVAARSVS